MHPATVSTDATLQQVYRQEPTPTICLQVHAGNGWDQTFTHQASAGACASVPLKTCACLQIHAGMVGVDLAVLIEKQELLSLKLLDAALETSLAATSSHAEAVVVELSIDDISIRDLQVHLLVVQPPGLAVLLNGWTLVEGMLQKHKLVGERQRHASCGNCSATAAQLGRSACFSALKHGLATEQQSDAAACLLSSSKR